MKHWMAVGAAALLATGISLTDRHRDPQLVLTPGLPLGWKSEGLAAGVDEVGVHRPDRVGKPELLIRRYRDTPAGKPLTIYQTIDAVPWRGRTIVYASTMHTYLEPEVMQRIANAPVSERRIECDGTQPGSKASVDDAQGTRTWVENKLRLKVADDATRCSFGLTVFVKGQFRLSRVHLKDDSQERAAYLAKHGWPIVETQSNVLAKFPADAAGPAEPNLEFKQ